MYISKASRCVKKTKENILIFIFILIRFLKGMTPESKGHTHEAEVFWPN